jgi:DNA topoisomerase VI subunit B
MTAPTVFSTDRLLEFTSVSELSKLVGYTPPDWPVVAIKELVDNSLDTCEDAGIAPAITVAVSTAARAITVADNGPGIAPDVVERLVDLRSKTSSREAYAAPTRGAQGNALQTILAMPFALDGAHGRTVIEAQGIAHTIDFTIDHVHRIPRVNVTRRSSSVQFGTSVTIHWPVSASSQLDHQG